MEQKYYKIYEIGDKYSLRSDMLIDQSGNLLQIKEDRTLTYVDPKEYIIARHFATIKNNALFEGDIVEKMHVGFGIILYSARLESLILQTTAYGSYATKFGDIIKIGDIFNNFDQYKHFFDEEVIDMVYQYYGVK